MRWFSCLLLSIALTALAAPALAQGFSVVSLEVKPQPVTVAPGGAWRTDLVLTIATKFHINGPSAGEAGLIPSKVKLSGPTGLVFAPPAYPKAHKVKVQFADQPVEMYNGKVVVGLSGQAASNLSPGTYPVKAQISFQACDDMVCHMPSSQEISFKVKVTKKP